MSMITLSAVSKSYRRASEQIEILKSLDLTIAGGEFVAVMGPSGSGKSTLLNLIAGLDAPCAGAVSVAGQRLDRLAGSKMARWRARHVGFVFQSYHLLPALSAAENIEVPLLLTDLSAARRGQQVAAALRLVGLVERASHKPSQLSGGQQQRAAIARAIVADPSILVCDEPTGDLDRVSADEVMSVLRALNRTAGKTIVMVTHDATAAHFASRCIRLDKGVLAEATAETVH